MKYNCSQRKADKVDFHTWRELDTGFFHYHHGFLFPPKTLDFHQGRYNPRRTPLPKPLTTFQCILWSIQRDNFVLLESLWLLTFELDTLHMADRRLLLYCGNWIGILRPIYLHKDYYEQSRDSLTAQGPGHAVGTTCLHHFLSRCRFYHLWLLWEEQNIFESILNCYPPPHTPPFPSLW